MNRLPLPLVDDVEALTNLAHNLRVKSHPHLLPVLQVLLDGYDEYVAGRGNGHIVPQVVIAPAIAAYLRAHYASPNKNLEFIDTLRDDWDTRTCPMCGSMHSGQLDHLFPKEGYGSFSIFSTNLVPACKCNNKRGQVFLGVGNERILHPYFDDCLADRLVEARFTNLGQIPRTEIQLCVSRAHPEYAAIAFHFREIVSKSGVRRYLKDRWITLCRKPSLEIRALKSTPNSLERLVTVLEEELAARDDALGSKNNWDSMFIAGLLERTTCRWLYQTMLRPGRLEDGPLF
jgi:5-methylcytosine-specific restriction endonuclease McrA